LLDLRQFLIAIIQKPSYKKQYVWKTSISKTTKRFYCCNCIASRRNLQTTDLPVFCHTNASINIKNDEGEYARKHIQSVPRFMALNIQAQLCHCLDAGFALELQLG